MLPVSRGLSETGKPADLRFPQCNAIQRDNWIPHYQANLSRPAEGRDRQRTSSLRYSCLSIDHE